MKKLVLVIILAAISFVLVAEETPNPFDSIFGMKWGVTATEFKANFKFKTGKLVQGFYVSNFPLGDLTIPEIYFMFKNIGPIKDQKFKDQNFNNFVFDQVYMKFNPEIFESILSVFKIKYGEPKKIENSEIQNRMGAKFEQVYVLWSSTKRVIQLSKYFKQIDEGVAVFQSIDRLNEKVEQQENANEKAAEVL